MPCRFVGQWALAYLRLHWDTERGCVVLLSGWHESAFVQCHTTLPPIGLWSVLGRHRTQCVFLRI